MDNGQTNGVANGHVLEDPVPPPAEPYKAILLFGPPGSGKGTQGRILSAIPGFFHSATGDIFRSLDLQSHAGRVFWEYASHGELVPDEFTIDVWRQFIRGMEMINQFHPETELLILDGVPRSVRQAKLLEDTIEVVRIIHLKADFEKMVERLKRRAFKENRVDDAKDDVIRRRMRVYEETTRPLLDHYDDDLVVEIDATQSQIRVLERIIEMLVPLKEQIDAKTGDSFVAPNAPLPAATV
ncbi:MAG: nucleoside monophosphate kinase [Planctomycetota bacterium]